MHKFVWSSFIFVVSLSLVLLGQPGAASAQEHVVSSSELQKDVAASAYARQSQEARLESFLSTPAAREAMKRANVDYKTVEKGIHILSDQEVAQLSARADKAQADFAAGSISWQELLIVAIAVIAIIVVLAIYA